MSVLCNYLIYQKLSAVSLIAKLPANGFSLESLKSIHSYLSNRVQRVKISSCFSDCNNTCSIYGPLLFNIVIFDLFFDDNEINSTNYARVTSPCSYDLENEVVAKLLAKNFDKLFHLFWDKFLNVYPK